MKSDIFIYCKFCNSSAPHKIIDGYYICACGRKRTLGEVMQGDRHGDWGNG